MRNKFRSGSGGLGKLQRDGTTLVIFRVSTKDGDNRGNGRPRPDPSPLPFMVVH